MPPRSLLRMSSGMGPQSQGIVGPRRCPRHACHEARFQPERRPTQRRKAGTDPPSLRFQSAVMLHRGIVAGGAGRRVRLPDHSIGREHLKLTTPARPIVLTDCKTVSTLIQEGRRQFMVMTARDFRAILFCIVSTGIVAAVALFLLRSVLFMIICVVVFDAWILTRPRMVRVGRRMLGQRIERRNRRYVID